MDVQFGKIKEHYKSFLKEDENTWKKATQFPKRWGEATRAEFKEVYGAAKKHREEMLQTISDSVNVNTQLGGDNQKFIDEWSNATFENRDKLLAGASKSMQDYISTVGDGEATWEGFVKYQQNAAEQLKATSLSARAAAAGMKVLNAAMSMAVMVALQFAIQKLVEGLDYLIHMQDKLNEKAEEARKQYEETTEELNAQEEALKKFAKSLF